MEIGATGVSNLTPDRPPPQSASPARSDSGAGPVGGNSNDKPLSELVGAVKESPSAAGSDDKPRDRVDISV